MEYIIEASAQAEVKMDLLQIGLIVGAVQGLFVSSVVWRVKRGPAFLGAYLAVVSLTILLPVLVRADLVRFVHLTGVIFPLLFLLGPLLLIHTSGIGSSPLKRSGLHFLPAAAAALLLLPFYLQTSAEKIAFYSGFSKSVPTLMVWLWGAAVVHAAGYIGLALRRIKETRHKPSRWLVLLLWSNLVLWLAYFAAFVFSFFDIAVYTGASLATAYGYANSCLNYLVSYRILVLAPSFHPHDKYSRSGLTPAMEEEYLQRVREYMNDQRAYLRADLTLAELARTLDIRPKYLSQLLNQKLQTNFYDFVNRHRVEEVLRRLRKGDAQAHTLLALAYESGFRSKSTFNAAFRKFTGKTPSQFDANHG